MPQTQTTVPMQPALRVLARFRPELATLGMSYATATSPTALRVAFPTKVQAAVASEVVRDTIRGVQLTMNGTGGRAPAWDEPNMTMNAEAVSRLPGVKRVITMPHDEKVIVVTRDGGAARRMDDFLSPQWGAAAVITRPQTRNGK